MAAKVVCFGEIMLRLSTPGYQRFVQAQSFDVTYGGGEANVAVSLANFGLDACFVTKVPNNPIGQSAVNHLRRFGVNTSYIARGGNRLGIYFLETGASQRPSKVVYDRAHSAIAEARTEDFNWPEILAGARWFHFTGITPALSDNVAEITLVAARTAKELGLTVSCDLNYRKNLWTPEKANQVMSRLMEYVDVCIANEEDAEKVFGIKAAGSDIIKGALSDAGYQDVARQLVERFGFKYVAITLRESYSASDNGWSALLYDGKEFYKSRKYDIRIVDRVGGGDSFGGGLIYALLAGKGPEEAINFAVAASCLKHTIPGDFNMVSIDEVENLVKGDGSGRVQR
ncbi:sugar kinase [Desulfofundulus sp. TPOSR]|uniref:PfkB domain protein n=1 Tax=Desulfofundulus kuznetsovii (strain DSM 6115 / VKM B-1805 / 17) TaxID=760568 RepID=A0AAU8Q2Q4_DESK7|nr:sugar kinase [Desulfofundulus sp. TPOSR]AEG15208.1 PfkB domain protein [Desulfofundulus kuznetsovii DSM 6115]NHM28347.1 sugar kinase [Desulfofundulus sp. TPOSR]